MATAITRSYIIENPTGFHARPARRFADTAAKLPCDIRVRKDGKTVNGKSVLAMLTLGAKHNDRITIEVSGDKAEEAISILGDIVSKAFEE
jgi:phosphocarrier protein HPr